MVIPWEGCVTMIGIYKITNKDTGEVYIGQSTNVENRISEHKQKRTQTIDNYINVLGVEHFSFEVLEECLQEDLDDKEKYYINQYDSINNGYNYQEGGFNNSIGAGNGRALLSEEDVILIRKAYANHQSPKETYEKVKHTGITYSAFQSVWQGQCWKHIMPEVFTEENKKFYTNGIASKKAAISLDNVTKYRLYYVDHTWMETYNLYVEDCNKENKSPLTGRSFFKILSGDVSKNSIYLSVPVYKKRKKVWLLHGEPVSTISESGE